MVLMSGSRSRYTSSITNNTNVYSVMGGLAPQNGINYNGLKASKRRARNQQTLSADPVIGKKQMERLNILSKNPVGSGGVGRTSFIAARAIGPCNCRGVSSYDFGFDSDSDSDGGGPEDGGSDTGTDDTVVVDEECNEDNGCFSIIEVSEDSTTNETTIAEQPSGSLVSDPGRHPGTTAPAVTGTLWVDGVTGALGVDEDPVTGALKVDADPVTGTLEVDAITGTLKVDADAAVTTATTVDGVAAVAVVKTALPVVADKTSIAEGPASTNLDQHPTSSSLAQVVNATDVSSIVIVAGSQLPVNALPPQSSSVNSMCLSTPEEKAAQALDVFLFQSMLRTSGQEVDISVNVSSEGTTPIGILETPVGGINYRISSSKEMRGLGNRTQVGTDFQYALKTPQYGASSIVSGGTLSTHHITYQMLGETISNGYASLHDLQASTKVDNVAKGAGIQEMVIALTAMNLNLLPPQTHNYMETVMFAVLMVTNFISACFEQNKCALIPPSEKLIAFFNENYTTRAGDEGHVGEYLSEMSVATGADISKVVSVIKSTTSQADPGSSECSSVSSGSLECNTAVEVTTFTDIFRQFVNCVALGSDSTASSQSESSCDVDTNPFLSNQDTMKQIATGFDVLQRTLATADQTVTAESIIKVGELKRSLPTISIIVRDLLSSCELLEPSDKVTINTPVSAHLEIVCHIEALRLNAVLASLQSGQAPKYGQPSSKRAAEVSKHIKRSKHHSEAFKHQSFIRVIDLRTTLTEAVTISTPSRVIFKINENESVSDYKLSPAQGEPQTRVKYLSPIPDQRRTGVVVFDMTDPVPRLWHLLHPDGTIIHSFTTASSTSAVRVDYSVTKTQTVARADGFWYAHDVTTTTSLESVDGLSQTYLTGNNQKLVLKTHGHIDNSQTEAPVIWAEIDIYLTPWSHSTDSGQANLEVKVKKQDSSETVITTNYSPTTSDPSSTPFIVVGERLMKNMDLEILEIAHLSDLNRVVGVITKDSGSQTTDRLLSWVTPGCKFQVLDEELSLLDKNTRTSFEVVWASYTEPAIGMKTPTYMQAKKSEGSWTVTFSSGLSSS